MNRKSTTRIIFMGTPAFSLPSLRLLHQEAAANHWEIVAVCTQPDRRAGRGKKAVISPVKAYALEEDIPVLQPNSFRKQPEMIDALREQAPDLYAVAAYGIILPKKVLDIPMYGSINVHASILPAYRGASPITAALLDGLAETGVSIMLQDVGMDTGPVLSQSRLEIRPADTTETLSMRLAEEGARTLLETAPGWLSGDIAPIAQDQLPGEPTLCRLIKKQDGEIDWGQPATRIERMTRAYAPWPGAYTSWNDAVFKIIEADVVDGTAQPGCIVQIDGAPAVGTGAGLLRLKMVQPAGKRAMVSKSFVNGAPRFVGSRLGSIGEAER